MSGRYFEKNAGPRGMIYTHMSRFSPIFKRLIITYASSFIFFSSLFIILFHIPFVQFQKIFFYKGLAFLAVTTLTAFVGIIVLAKRNATYIESLIAAVVLSAAIHLSIFIVFPVTVERSVTIFLLSQLKQSDKVTSCKGLTEKQMQSALINTYILKNNAVSKRINEQNVIQTIEKKDQCIQLTRKGVEFLNFSTMVSKLYNIRQP